MMVPGPFPTGIPGNWRCVWREEFNQQLGPKFEAGWPLPGGLTPPMSAGEVACYDPACVTVKGSLCRLAAIAKQQEVADVRYSYATGLIATPDLVYLPGYCVESRANFTGQNHAGLWTAPAEWPVGGECDTVEWLSDGKSVVATSNYHSSLGTANSGQIPGHWTGWHLFSSHYGIGPNPVSTSYFDGHLVATHPIGAGAAAQRLLASIMLDNLAPIVVPNVVVIDYVRIFEPA